MLKFRQKYYVETRDRRDRLTPYFENALSRKYIYVKGTMNW